MAQVAGSGQRDQPPFIAMFEQIVAHTQQITRHRNRVAYGTHTTSRHVIPGDRRLANAVATLAGNRKEFDVEAPALNRLMQAEIERDIAAHDLKAALRIFDAGERQQLHQRVEGAAHQMAVKWLAKAVRAGSLARGD